MIYRGKLNASSNVSVYTNGRSRSRKRSRRSANDALVKIKIGVVSGVIRATESESKESVRFHFLPTPLTTPSLRSADDLVKTRLSESESEA